MNIDPTRSDRAGTNFDYVALSIALSNRAWVEGHIAGFIAMLATLMTFAFLAATGLAAAVIAAALAKGFAAAPFLRRQLAVCGDERLVTVRHQRAASISGVIPARVSQRPVRSAAPLLHRPARRAAA